MDDQQARKDSVYNKPNFLQASWTCWRWHDHSKRTGSRAIKPVVEFTLDMYRAAGYDELVANQRIYFKQRRLCLAREQKSIKAKRFWKPPSSRKVAASSTLSIQPQGDADMQNENDRLMRELFGSEGGDISIDDDEANMNDGIDKEEESQIEVEDEDVHMNDPDSKEEDDKMEEMVVVLEEDED